MLAQAVEPDLPLGLVSFFKPLMLLIPFVPWAILVSKVFDKHAARWHLPREAWGAGHLVAGTVAVLVAISLPMKSDLSFWIGWASMIVILAADVAVFMNVTNKDERVPETFRLRLNLDSFRQAREDKAKAKLAGRAELVVKTADKALVPVPQSDAPDFPVRIAAENVVLRALGARASQIDFEPASNAVYRVLFMIDGVRTPAVLADHVPSKDGTPPPPAGVMPAAEAMKVINFWRAAAKHDVNDTRKKQTGDMSVERDTQRTKIRVTCIGSSTGPRVTMLFEPEAAVRRKFEALGLLEPQVKALRAIIDDGKGVVLVAAPLDQGRTTTLYTVLKQHDAYTKNVQTLEIDQQDSLEGAKQNVFDPFAEGAEFATTLRSILRRDPDVVGVAELPDAATAKEAARVDVERCRVYLSFKADNALGAIQAWVKLVGDPDAATKVLHGVISQRLVRKLCTNCRVAYPPSAEMLKLVKLPPDKVKQLFKKGGQVLVKNRPETCPACAGAGFVGLEGCFEVFPINAPERALIKAGNLQQLRVEFRKQQLPTIEEAALRKVLDGITSIDEMARVTKEVAEGPKPPPPAQQPSATPAVPAAKP